jgi:hypothetical protein
MGGGLDMPVAETSKIAYQDHKAQGKVGRQAQALYEFMDENVPYSRKELSKATGMELASVCARVNEMIDVGMLREVEKRKCLITGRLISPVVKDGTLF